MDVDLPGTGRRARLATARLYLCTDSRRERGDLAAFADAALRGGVDVIQLREKGLEAREELTALEVLADAARRHGALLAVNDRADVAPTSRRRETVGAGLGPRSPLTDIPAIVGGRPGTAPTVGARRLP